MPGDITHEIPEWFASLATRTAAFDVVNRKRLASGQTDWALKLQPAGGKTAVKILVEAKQRLTPQEFLAFVERFPPNTDPVVVCSPTISPRVAELCRQKGIGYLDAAGNCHVQIPGLFIHIEGQPVPRSSRREAANPFATKSSRIARVLLSHVDRGWQVQELAREANVSLGLTSRIKRALLDEAFVELRDDLLFVRDPSALLEAWRSAYQLPKRQSFYVMDANPQSVERRIAEWSAETGIRYALTAYPGAWRLAPMVRHNMSTIYLDALDHSDLAPLIATLDAKRVDSGANLSIWLPHDAFTFYGVKPIKRINLVSAIQLYLDLSHLPGRGEEAAREIFERELQPTWQT